MPAKSQIVVSVERLEATCFVIMPFAATYQTLYERILRPAIQEAGLQAVRADEVFSKAQVTHEIWDQVRNCRIVLAELTGRNPNVLYELGLAHAIGKPTIIITRDEGDVPFDLRALRFLFYDTNDPFWGETLKEQITRMLSRALSNKDFGSVLGGIELQGSTELTDRPAAVAPPRARNVSGQWHAVFRFDSEKEDTAWSVSLTQSENILSGTLVSSTTYKATPTIAQETLSGEIEDDQVRFYATSYTFIEQGKIGEWHLDRFWGVLSSDGRSVTGKIDDNAGHTADIVLRRIGKTST